MDVGELSTALTNESNAPDCGRRLNATFAPIAGVRVLPIPIVAAPARILTNKCERKGSAKGTDADAVGPSGGSSSPQPHFFKNSYP